MTVAAAGRQSRIFIVAAGVVGKATGEGSLGFAEAIGVEMPPLRATVTVNDRLVEIVSGEVAALEAQADGEADLDGGRARTDGVPA